MTSVVTTIDGAYVPGTTSGPYPARPGNRVRALIDGPSIMRRIGEAVAHARHSIWVTVAFYSDDFLLPDGQEPLFDVLDRAVARGVDVRLLAWRRSRFRIRWDRAATVFCQHQKSWVIDAGQPSETSFVGGLNLTSAGMRFHDVYVEVTGPAATDVRHNFVERWNEASDRHAADGNWCCDASDELPYADQPRPACGTSTVQIQRMLDARRYPPARVERSILEQYQRAIDAARRTIYLQNQAIPVAEVARHLLAAVERGVEIVMLVPAVPERIIFEARLDPAEASQFWGIEALGHHANFTLAGLAEMHEGKRRAAYVHAKMMLVDDVWVTIGSCNLHPRSLNGHTEMNASVWDAVVVRTLRDTLFARHLGLDTASLNDRTALQMFRDIARANRDRLERGAPDWEGRVFALKPETYGFESGVKPDLT